MNERGEHTQDDGVWRDEERLPPSELSRAAATSAAERQVDATAGEAGPRAAFGDGARVDTGTADAPARDGAVTGDVREGQRRQATMGTTGTPGTSGADVLTDTDETAGTGGIASELGTGGEPDRRGLPFDPLPDEGARPRRAVGYSAGSG